MAFNIFEKGVQWTSLLLIKFAGQWLAAIGLSSATCRLAIDVKTASPRVD
jgi:hypothetical protein